MFDKELNAIKKIAERKGAFGLIDHEAIRRLEGLNWKYPMFKGEIESLIQKYEKRNERIWESLMS